MPHKFSDEDKEVKEFRDSLPFGVSRVQLVLAEAGALDDGREYIEVNVQAEDGIEDSARCWFTGGASNISFNTLRQVAVHQGKDEEEKQKIRDKVDAVKDSQELCDILNEYIGGELWVRKEYDPKRTYQNQAGVTKRSVNTNLFGYQPAERPEFMPKKADANGNAVEDAFPDGEDITNTPAAKTVPKDDDWSK